MRKYVWFLVGGVAGAIAGYVYWLYIGCTSGSCPITSSPVNSSIYGCVMGVMTVNLFRKNPPLSNP
jgi:Family of unknown function (DUF6132)